MTTIRPLEDHSIRRIGLLALVLLSTVLGGCIARPGGPGGPGVTTDPGSPGETTSGGETATATATSVQTGSPVYPPSAAERAITAEKERIRKLNASKPRVQGLGIGILRGTDRELLDRNVTGVILRIEVGYSVELDCNESAAGLGQSVDGAATITRYFVTDYEVRLLSTETAFVDPADYCE